MPDRDRLTFDFSALTPLAPPPWLAERAAAMNVAFDTGDVEKLGLFLALLFAGNEHLNLTAVKEPDAAWEKHVLDSLTLLQVIAEVPEGSRVIDVGTGGGLPGVPLAICCPHLKFVLLDATKKKTQFLDAVIRRLGLKNATTCTGRAEEVGHDRGTRTSTGRTGGHREIYDAVVARAVGKLSVLAELVVPLAKSGGVIALIKGGKAPEEIIEAVEALRLIKATALPPIKTPTGQIVLLRKDAATPKIFPRRSGEPARAPLGASAIAKAAWDAQKPVGKEKSS